jgi:hypothetical protein
MRDALTELLNELMTEPRRPDLATLDFVRLKKDITDRLDWLFKRAILSDRQIIELSIRRSEVADKLVLVPVLQPFSGSAGRPKGIGPWFFGAVMKKRLEAEASTAVAVANEVFVDYMRLTKLLGAESNFVPAPPSRERLRNLSSRCPEVPGNIPASIISTIDSLVIALVHFRSR